MKHVALLFTILLSALLSFGQREINNIYLFDCTGSMRGNQLWEPAKSALDATIATQTGIPGSQFNVIMFGDAPYESFSFNAEEYSGVKGDIGKAMEKYIAQAKYTRISDVLKSGFSKANPAKDNKIYLLTDGKPNNGDSPEKVARTISEWCGSHRNSRLFYVALQNGVIDPVIKKAIDDCKDAFIVQCQGKVIPQFADISPNGLHTNLQELAEPRDIHFSLPGKYKVVAASNDPLFDVCVKNNSAENGKIRIFLMPKNGLTVSGLHQKLQGEEYVFNASLSCSDQRIFIANPNIEIHVADGVPSALTIAQGVDELQAPGIEWYDSFLWKDAAPDTKAVWNLSPVFKNRLPGAQLDLKLQVPDEQGDDFRAWYNGKPVGKDGIITIMPDEPALLEVQFNHDAQTGKRYFSLMPQNIKGVDMINGQPAGSYEGTSLRTDYKVVWNPLKTLLVWLAIIAISALILWLAVLKHIFYPKIKMARVTVSGPGSYYMSKQIKGARKVVLTSKRKSQNIFSRIFTGEVRFIKGDHFTQELSITPATGKKKVRISSEGKSENSWDIFPSAIFNQYDKGAVTNRKTNDKSEIEFN